MTRPVSIIAGPAQGLISVSAIPVLTAAAASIFIPIHTPGISLIAVCARGRCISNTPA